MLMCMAQLMDSMKTLYCWVGKRNLSPPRSHRCWDQRQLPCAILARSPGKVRPSLLFFFPIQQFGVQAPLTDTHGLNFPFWGWWILNILNILNWQGGFMRSSCLHLWQCETKPKAFWLLSNSLLFVLSPAGMNAFAESLPDVKDGLEKRGQLIMFNLMQCKSEHAYGL